jgi:hypothetical protein
MCLRLRTGLNCTLVRLLRPALLSSPGFELLLFLTHARLNGQVKKGSIPCKIEYPERLSVAHTAGTGLLVRAACCDLLYNACPKICHILCQARQAPALEPFSMQV